MKRTLNPCAAVPAFTAQQCHISVDGLYDVLNKCWLPVRADHLSSNSESVSHKF